MKKTTRRGTTRKSTAAAEGTTTTDEYIPSVEDAAEEVADRLIVAINLLDIATDPDPCKPSDQGYGLHEAIRLLCDLRELLRKSVARADQERANARAARDQQ